MVPAITNDPTTGDNDEVSSTGDNEVSSTCSKYNFIANFRKN